MRSFILQCVLLCQTHVIFSHIGSSGMGSTITWNELGMDAGLDYIFIMTMQFNVQPVTVHV